MSRIWTWLLVFFLTSIAAGNAQTSSKPISRQDLVQHLSKAIDLGGLCDFCKTSDGRYPGPVTDITEIVDYYELSDTPVPNTREAIIQSDRIDGLLFDRYQDVLRLIRNVKPKFVTDAISLWGGSVNWPPWQLEWRTYLNRGAHTVKDIKDIDNDIIVQASINEYMNDALTNSIGNIPSWVFDEFNLLVEVRKFDINKMRFSDYLTNADHHWDGGAIVPDISSLETKMIFYYLGVKYINMGCESLQFCQVEMMNNRSNDPTNWNDLFRRLRNYATGRPDIRYLLITGHTNGMKDAVGRLSFDYHSSPIRPSETGYSLNVNGGGCYLNADQCWAGDGKLYKSSIGGISPSGWSCDALPGLVFLDNNYSHIDKAGTSAGEGCNQYHWDEISWFAMQSESYRNDWLRYASNRVRQLDSNIHFALIIKKNVHCRATGVAVVNYLANNSTGVGSALLPPPNTIDNVSGGLTDRSSVQLFAGYGQENTIKDILANNTKTADEVISVSIFPNPVDDILYFRITASQHISLMLFYTITNTMGLKVMKGYLPDTPLAGIDFSALSSGIYFIRVFDEHQNVFLTQKILRK